MLNKLQQKWGVNGWQLLLILCTFALGGSLCGYIGRRLMGLLPIQQPVLWTIVYIIVVSLVWPACVLLASIPLGQFVFFRKYLKKLWRRISGKSHKA